jgi:hypothetical protein
MAVNVPSQRYALRKAGQGLWVDPIGLLAGQAVPGTGAPGSGGVTNLQAQQEVDHALSVRSFQVVFTDGGTAATAVAEFPANAPDLFLSNGIQILRAEYCFALGVVTGAGVTLDSFFLNKRTSGGAAVNILANTNAVADPTFGAGVTAWKSVPATLVATAAAAIVQPTTDVMTFNITKGGTGVAFGAGVLTVFYQEL